VNFKRSLSKHRLHKGRPVSSCLFFVFSFIPYRKRLELCPSRTIAEYLQQERGELGRGTEVKIVLARHEDILGRGGIALTFLTSTIHGGE
jgi:hypothetical protein